MSDHEYSVVGHSRSKIGMVIALFSGGVAGGITTLVGFAVSYLQSRQVELPEIILWPLTGSVVFGILFLLFNKFIWRISRLRGVIGIPDVSGSWALTGQSFDVENKPKYSWEGAIEITQCYEKITVYLKTSQSSSQSVSAAIVDEGRAGWRLIYSYRNQPKPGETDMNAHLGHCELLFSDDLSSAEGHYFNGGGRFTHGNMKLEKVLDQ
ncbi:Cap15 family cyclic dinucleotide receptor domain-containing protein [Phaeobacter inhibens]|uniref:Cap15 family cyclic dinucleotide receptor domain-containing protein n=1 Tax=Phaeobacter inhibens TaxID=221822 RepID=UPI0021A3AFD1|nr:hypothetical protein [Phaeobacter inhibens]UWS07073.1 hypothetical protein K4K98_12590 [Phaeobacter inhibens]